MALHATDLVSGASAPATIIIGTVSLGAVALGAGKGGPCASADSSLLLAFASGFAAGAFGLVNSSS